MKTRSTPSGSCGTLITILVLLAASATAADNPFSYMVGINDCDVLKYNGEYYITGNWLAGDMLSSSDLRSWGRRTHVFSYDNTWHLPIDPGDPDRDIHGTHLRYHNGQFHLYAHLEVVDGIAHAVSDSIWGPYVEPLDAPFANWIDADTFKDEDGALHFYSTRIAGGQERIFRRDMVDPNTLVGVYQQQIAPSGGWEGGTNINEGSKVFKHRGRYYMLYNAYPTSDPDYAIGCVAASHPTAFANSGKYANAILQRAVPGPGSDEVAYIGQPWIVRGLNGLEHWVGYFGQTPSEGRTQRIDRAHFFDKTLFVEGPTNRYSAGYHPGPARPQYLGLFNDVPSRLPAAWSRGNGMWRTVDGELRQSALGAATTTLLRDAADHYVFEINFRFLDSVVDQQAGARLYDAGADNFLIVGVHQTSDPATNNFYVHLRENGIDNVQAVPLPMNALDLTAYHKLRIERNGPQFHFWLDDQVHAPVDIVTATTFGPDQVGLYTNNAVAAFDGIIYTIGWDEYDERITGWGAAADGTPPTGTWQVDGNGLTQLDPAGGQAFKGERMPTYEFATQVTDLTGSGARAMGVFAIAIDPQNYLIAAIDQVSSELYVHGAIDGASLAPPTNVPIPPATSHNIRVVKRADRVILFIDGVERMTVWAAFGPSQVGMYCAGMSARYNGILAYQTEADAVAWPWSRNDIGTVGFVGSAWQNGDTFALTASGADIWTTQDSLGFVHQPITGDVDVIARVVHHGMTDWWQKAGVMIREDLTADAPHVSTVLTAVDAHTGSATFCSRIWREQRGFASGAADLTVATNNHPHWVRIKRVGDMFTGYSSTDGETWTPVGNAVWSPMAAAAEVGLVLTAHNNDRITDATFDHVRILSPLPGPWQTTNIGATTLDGLAGYRVADGAFEVDGSGAEICCASDAFRYVYRELPGDGAITARVVSLEPTGPRAKAGLMIREALDHDSRHFAVEMHGSGVIGTNRRLVAGTGSGEDYAAGGPFAPPYWLRLTRTAGQYACEMSADGVNWLTVAGPYADAFAGQSAYVGLTTCANASATLSTAVFDNVTVTLVPKSADLDDDGAVDLRDVAMLQACCTGASGGPPAGDCNDADLDHDEDVDVDDLGTMAEVLSGPA